MAGASFGQNRRAAAASTVGTTLEWYDFFLFAICTQLIFPTQFFPADSPTAGTLGSFATFGVAFLARPLGAVYFGALGDRRGRRSALVATLLTMGLATVLIGVLPGYATLGVLSPILLTLLRLAQGFAIGGEWGGAVLLSVENAPPGRRGFYGVFAQLGNPLGSVLANGVLQVIVWSVSDEAFHAWGWRIGFLASGVLVVAGLIIRLRISETEAFQALPGRPRRMPVRELVYRYPRIFAISVIVQIATSFGAYGLIGYAGVYATTVVGVPAGWVLAGGVIGAASSIPVFLLLGRLSDRIGRKPVFALGAGGWLVIAFPFYWLIGTGTFAGVVVANVLAWAVGFAGTYAVQASLLAELFPTQVRYTAVSTSYQLAAVLWSAPVGFVASALVAQTGSVSWVPAIVVAGAVITLSLIPALRETRDVSLTEDITPVRLPGELSVR